MRAERFEKKGMISKIERMSVEVSRDTARRELGRQYKEAAPPLLREYIYAATAAKYGDPLGPDYESLRRRKSCAEVIEAAARPIKNLDERITIEGFREWYRRREKD